MLSRALPFKLVLVAASVQHCTAVPDRCGATLLQTAVVKKDASSENMLLAKSIQASAAHTDSSSHTNKSMPLNHNGSGPSFIEHKDGLDLPMSKFVASVDAPSKPETLRESKTDINAADSSDEKGSALIAQPEAAHPLANETMMPPRFGATLVAQPETKNLESNGTSAPPQVEAALPEHNSLSALFNDLGFSVIRIQAIESKAKWFTPYEPPEHVAVTGSGFAVAAELQNDSDPVFLTNAHVVRNANSVQVQLPAIGQQPFTAYVPMICDQFDLAVVRLTDPKAFQQALMNNNGTLRPLKVEVAPLSLALEVAAVGFPLGSTSLKLSTGVISGAEEVSGTMRYQSTAPISPGSSGGPLFARGKLEDKEVIGVNFASSSSSSAQNTNFVVANVHMQQVLNSFSTWWNTETPQENVTFQLRVAPVDAVAIESSETLYNSSGGCNAGVYLSRILPTSVLNFANPPVPDRSFLVEVDGVQLDSFGMGRTEHFLGDLVSFTSLLTLKEKIADNITFKICNSGKTSSHSLTMQWRPEFESGIRFVDEPQFEPAVLDFEEFADVTVMQLTLNHLEALLAQGYFSLGRWLLPDFQKEPRLIITHIQKGTYANRILQTGMIVESMNGHKVSTLSDFREHFFPNGSAWTLETDRGYAYAVDFREALIKQLEEARRPGMKFLTTKATKAAAIRLSLWEDPNEQKLSE